jgi:hypothetical protein
LELNLVACHPDAPANLAIPDQDSVAQAAEVAA